MRVLLALDGDEAGQKATLNHIEAIADFSTSWGTPRGAGPSAQSLARYQNERDALTAPGFVLDEQAEVLLEELGFLITDSYHALFQDREWTRCESAEEYQEFMRPKPPPPYQAGKIDFTAIKNRIDLVDWVHNVTGQELLQRGNTFKTTCPLPEHDDKTASFFIYPENRNWNCFGCNQWGDIFDLAKALGIKPRDL